MIRVVIVGLLSGFIGGIFAQQFHDALSPIVYGKVGEDSSSDVRDVVVLALTLIALVTVAYFTVRMSSR